MNKNNQSPDMGKLTERFKALAGNRELMIQLLEILTVPVEIFSADGLSIYVNPACMREFNHHDEKMIVETYNLKHDPYCLGLFGQEKMDRIFNGEVVYLYDIPVPMKGFLDEGKTIKKPYEAATMDMVLLPLWEGDVFTHTVCLFDMKNMYQGRADIIKAQEYIKEHWRDEFDIEKIARAANLSKRYFQRIFKEVAGKTPIEYYQELKIQKLQEKLFDGNISVEQAFDACGVDSRNTYLKLFKDKVGMTPAEYRKLNNIQ